MKNALDSNGDGKLNMKDVKKSSKAVASDVREKTIGYLTAALGLVAGLAWNDAIKAFIEAYYPLSQDSLAAKFMYAGLVTVIVVVLTAVVVKLAKQKEQEQEEK